MLHMGPGGQFGYHTTKLFMHRLVGNEIRQHAAIPANSGSRFITTGFDSKNGNGHVKLFSSEVKYYYSVRKYRMK
jgi:hypothetical protein